MYFFVFIDREHQAYISSAYDYCFSDRHIVPLKHCHHLAEYDIPASKLAPAWPWQGSVEALEERFANCRWNVRPHMRLVRQRQGFDKNAAGVISKKQVKLKIYLRKRMSAKASEKKAFFFKLFFWSIRFFFLFFL